MSRARKRESRLFAALLLALPGLAPSVQAATFPTDTRVQFQTSGAQRCANIGDWYSTVNGSGANGTSSPEPCATNDGTNSTSTARYSEFFLEVTESMAPATVEILDAESTDGPGSICDEVDGGACDGVASGTGDPTRFELRNGDGTVLLAGTTVPSGSAHGTTVTFSGLGVGLYRIRSYDGSDQVPGLATGSYGDQPTNQNDDDNSFQIRVNGGAAIDGLLGFLQTTYQQDTGATINYQMYFMVGPALANSTLALRNFDLDGGAGGTTYNRAPDATGASVAGTVSGNGVWNGGGSLNAGQDSVVANNAIGSGAADAGTWGYRINAWTSSNQTIFEANNTGVRLALTDTIPTRAGFFTITPNDTLATTVGVSVDHGFTVTNLFFTADLINFSLSGTSANYTVQLRTDPNCDGNGSDGALLTDLDGDGQPDTGLLNAANTAGSSACFVLRTTPNVGAATSDTTRVSAVSFMDKKVVPSSNTTRFVEKTTLLPPSISKNFSPNPLATGGTAALTFSLTNINTVPVTLGTAAAAYAFTDTFPVSPGAMTLANTTVTNTCGGTLTDIAGGALNAGDTGIRYSGGTIPAAGSCTVAVNVTATAIGDYGNTSTALTSTNAGNGGTANATLTVQAATAPSIAKAFSPSPVGLNADSTLTLTITNSNSTAFTGLAFSDTYPAGLVNGPAPGVTNSCGGSTTGGAAGGNTIGLTGGTLAGNSSCTVTVQVRSAAAGSYLNTTGSVSSTNGGTGNTASATLVVNAPPGIAKSFSPDPINNGGTSVLTITLSNPNSVALTGAAFTDTYPAAPASAAIVNAGTPGAATTCGGGIVTAAAGGGSVALSGGVIPASGSCVVTVNVTKNTAGTGTNTIPIGGLTTTNSINNTVAASDTLTSQAISPPTITKSFSPDPIQNGGTSTLTLVIGNPNPTATLSGVAVSDTYPANLVNSTTPAANAAVSCTSGSAGSFTGGANGGNTIGFTGGSLLAGGSCTVTVRVTSTVNATYTNTTGVVTSGNGGTGGTASDTLTVQAGMVPPVINKAFSVASTGDNNIVTLTFTVTNPNAAGFSGLTFTDNFPNPAGAGNAQMVVSTPLTTTNTCAGTLDENDNGVGGDPDNTLEVGDFGIRLTGGTLAAESSCTVSVNVRGDLTTDASAVYSNVSGAVDSTQTVAGNTASASLTVTRPTIVKSFSPDPISNGGTSTLTIVLANSSAVAFTAAAFTDTYPAAITNSGTPAGSTTCAGGTVTAAANGPSVALSGATIPAGSSCQVTVGLTSSGGSNAVAASDTLTIPNRPTLSKSFNASTIPVLGVSTLTITLSNNNPIAATSASFTDTLPAGLVTSGSPSTDCGGTASSTTNTVSLSGGTIPAGAPGTCTVTINVLDDADTDSSIARAAGVYSNTIASGGLSTGFGTNAAAATANLNVIGGYKSGRIESDVDGSTTPTPGDIVQWSVFYHNPAGGQAVPSFQVTDSIDPGTTYVGGSIQRSFTGAGCGAGSTANASFNGTSNTNLFTAAFTYNADCTLRVDYSVTVGAAAAGSTIANQASGGGTGLSATLSDNIDLSTTGLPAGVNPAAGSVAQVQASTLIGATTIAVQAGPPVTLTKVSAVISDPYNNTTNPKRIPGAVIEYTLTISNPAGVAADVVVASDPIPAGTAYVTGSLRVNGVAEDEDAAGADETDPDGGDVGITAAGTVTGRIATIAAGASKTMVFRVTIN